MLYKKKEYASLLFPTKSEGYYNYEIINKRIKLNLQEEDYEWANKFTFSVSTHPDYEEIKKVLQKLPLEALIKYHECFQDILDSNLYKSSFKEICETIILINSNIHSLAHSIIGLRVPAVDDKENIRNFKSILEEQQTKILDENSDIIKDAYEQFDKMTESYKEKTYLAKYISMQRQDFYKLILHYLHMTAGLFNKKLEKIELDELNTRRWDEHYEHLKKQYHQKVVKGGYRKNYRE